MKLKNLLPEREITIEYRTNDPEGLDILAGYCKWDGNDLTPLDGDTYSIEDVIARYEWTADDYLTVWYKSTWI